MGTKTDNGGQCEWRIGDELTQFREWGAHTAYPVPPKRGEWIIGAADTCWLRLDDPTARISRQHAKLTRVDNQWALSDLQSKNGTCIDGARRLSVTLAPGLEIGIGGITLIADSPLLGALRDLLARLLGWASERAPEVDLALRSVRMTATRRESLLLCGDGDLIAIARLLHRHALGDNRPFILCDPGRRAAPDANYHSGLAALDAAAGGTICVWQSRPPADFADLAAAVRDPSSRSQLIICTHALHEPTAAAAIVIPRLSTRGPELLQVIDAYARDAVAELGGTFTAQDRAWVRRHESATHGQIEKATRRLAAIRSANGSITRAAAQLSMSHAALSEWIARRTLPDIVGPAT